MIGKIARRLLGVLTLTGILLAPTTVVATAAPAAIDNEQIEKSIVQLYISWKGTVSYTTEAGEQKVFDVTAGSSCTGWFVSTNGDIGTAGHCVDEARGPAKLKARFFVAENYTDAEIDQYWDDVDAVLESRSVLAYQSNDVEGVLDYDGITVEVKGYKSIGSGDHALLKINNFSKPTPPLVVAATAPKSGETVTSIGFPGSVSRNTDQTRQDTSFMPGTVSARQTTPEGVPFTQVSTGMSGGMSGGPTLNSNGEVIGVNSWGPGADSQNFNFVTDTESMRSFYTANGVSLQSAVPSSPSPTAAPAPGPGEDIVAPTSSDSGGVALGTILAVVFALLFLLLLVYVILGKRKQAAAAANTNQTPPSV